MLVNQRNITGQAIPNGDQYAVSIGPTNCFIADRWLVYRDGWATGGTMSNLACTTSDLPFTQDGLTNYIRIGRSDGATNGVNVCQHLETINSKPLAGKTMTLSFYARKGATFSSSGSAMFQRVWCGILTDKSLPKEGLGTGSTNSENSTALTQNWTKYTFTVTIPSTTTQLAISFSYTPTGSSSVTDYMDITGIQFEKGSIATPFEFRPYQIELQLCQRYFETIAYFRTVGCGCFTAGSAFMGANVFFKVSKRNASYSARIAPMNTVLSYTGAWTNQVYVHTQGGEGTFAASYGGSTDFISVNTSLSGSAVGVFGMFTFSYVVDNEL